MDLATRKKIIDEKKKMLYTMAKDVKLRIRKESIDTYIFIDTKRDNIFGYAYGLDNAISYLQNRFPQLKENYRTHA